VLPPYFFHFLKHIPVAKTQLAIAPAAEAADATTDVVKLPCNTRGVTARPTTPAHAKALLELQQAKGDNSWQPVDADAPTE
jgi:hypothetical protein